VHVILPPEYPYKSPSIGFSNRLFHPNVDERSGSVCLDVINQTWSPMFDLVNIFEVFLPQLLRYPNASDPLNSEAASLFLDNEESYNCKVRDYVQKYASHDRILGSEGMVDEEEGQKEGGAGTTGGSSRGEGVRSRNRDSSCDHNTDENDEDDDEMLDDFDDGASDISDMSDL